MQWLQCARRMLLRLLCFVLAVSACGGVPCTTGPRSTAPFLCAQSDGGIAATLYNETGTCSAARDGGSVVFTASISGCVNTGTNPVVITSNAPCDVSALPAGTYTTTEAVTGGTRAVTFTIPLMPDAGFSRCL